MKHKFVAAQLGAVLSLLLGFILLQLAAVCAAASINNYRERRDESNQLARLELPPPKDNVEKLHRKLLKFYDRTRVPINRDTNEAVNVSVYMWPYDILFVRESQSAIKICGWIDMTWTDPQLRWDPMDYGNLTETFIVRSELWLPEIDIYYRKDEPSEPTCTHCPVHVSYTGHVLRGYYFAYAFPCPFDVEYFPFDEHNCSMQLANWHMDDKYMNLFPKNTTVDTSIFLKNEEWELLSMTVERETIYYNFGNFPILTYTLSIRRKPFFYIINLVMPSFTLTMTALIGFHMSSMGSGTHQEKVKMGLTTILSIFFLQAGVSDKLPRTSDVVPLIAVFYSCMVGLLSLAIISSSLVIVIEKQGIYKQPVPAWAAHLFRLDTAVPDESVSRFNRVLPRSRRLKTNDLKSQLAAQKKCRMLDCTCSMQNGHPCMSLPGIAGHHHHNCDHLADHLLDAQSLGANSELVEYVEMNGTALHHDRNHQGCLGTPHAHHDLMREQQQQQHHRDEHEQLDEHEQQQQQQHQQRPDMLTQEPKSSLELAMNEMRLHMRKQQGRWKRIDRNNNISMDWLKLADRVENFALVSFMVMALISLMGFFRVGGII